MAGFVELCRRELELCAVQPLETVAVLTRGNERHDYADAFMAAAQSLGARAFHVRLPAEDTAGGYSDAGTWGVGKTPLEGNRAAVEALKQASLVVDLVFLLFSAEQTEIQQSGTRILTCLEPVDNLERMFPTQDQRRRVELSGELLSAARTMRITNKAGTDVVYQLGQYPVITEYGYTDIAGRWDHWPSGFLYTGGADAGVDGTVVLDRGDIIVTPFKRYVLEPTEIAIRKGRIESIRGGLDAELLVDYMAGFDDPRANGIAHIGWGCNERARWSGMENDRRSMGMESRAFYGCVLFSTGPNKELGGDNDTPCHIDIPMRNCSVSLDGKPVLIDGEFAVEELRLTGRR
jgi:2,5-dihydroxypyridine 5,6-dioxygenase